MFPIELLCGLVGLACGGAALSCAYALVNTVIDVVVGEEITYHDVGFATALVLWLGFSAAVLFDVLQQLVRLV